MWFRKRSVSPGIVVPALRSRLDEAVVWCKHALDTGRGFSGTALLPPRGDAEIREEASSGRASSQFTPTTAGSRLCQAPYALVAGVVALRAQRMAELGVSAAASSDALLESGRILCCGVNASLVDGACHVESRGFLDEDDLPPADTWIGLIPLNFEHLLTWVPERHVGDVDAAMPCCPTEAYRWLADADARLERALLRGR